MYDDRVVSVDIEDADLQECSVGGWSDKHRQVFVYADLAHRGTDGMQDVRVDNSVLARWLTDPHLDNISCLGSSVKEYTKPVPRDS